MKRREFLKAIAAIPIAGLAVREVQAKSCMEIAFHGCVVGSVKGDNLKDFQWQVSNCQHFSEYSRVGNGPHLSRADLKGYKYLRGYVIQDGPLENMIQIT